MSKWPEPLHLRGRVLPGGEVRDVFVVDGRLSYRQPDRARTILDGGYLVPGLVDAHAHPSLSSPAGMDAPAAERVRASGRAQVPAGVLAVREPGSPVYESRQVGPDTGGPRVVTAGRMIARTGRYFPGLGRQVEPAGLPDLPSRRLGRPGPGSR